MASPLVDFSSGFDAAFFSGVGTSLSVPDIYPVAIAGHPYMIDTAAKRFTRQYDARVRDSIDNSNEPGQGALNSQGLWRRGQSSWHYGAGQEHSDDSESEQYRFRMSKGVDIWTKKRMSLLKDVTQVLADTTSNLLALTVGDRLYVATGGNVKYTTDLVNFTQCTGEPAGNVLSMCTDGFNIFVAFTGAGIYRATTSSDAFTNYVSGTDSFNVVRHVKGRLMASLDNKVYNFTATGTPASGLLFTHANTSFRWVGFGAGQNHIYLAGFSGNTSLIYRTTILADATALATPIVASELPSGEIVAGLDAYLSWNLIGTQEGFRVATADDNGNLVVGPLIDLGVSVHSFSGFGKFVWFNWTNFDATSTGLGRLNLGVEISVNQPAYTSGVMATAQGVTGSANIFDGRPLFVVVGTGIYIEHATDLVASGYLETGAFDWDGPDPKFIPKWDIRCKPLDGTITLATKSDDGDYYSFATLSTTGARAVTLDGLEGRVYDAEAKITLTRSTTDVTQGPILTHWMAKAYVAPTVAQIFTVPIIMAPLLAWPDGTERTQDVRAEMRHLRDLKENARIVTYQEGEDSFSVIVEDVQDLKLARTDTTTYEWNGTVTVVMREVV